MWVPFEDQDIYKFYIGEYPIAGYKYKSPFRDDGTFHSLSFKEVKKGLMWTDFGGIEMNPFVTTRDGIGFVMQKECINTRDEAEAFVFNNILPRILKNDNKVKPLEKYKPQIKIRTTWRDYEYEYWEKVKPSLLLKHKVFPCHAFVQGGKDFGSTKQSPAFMYFFGEKYKLYRPYDKIFKWKSSNLAGVIEGYDQLPENAEELIITSSKKDSLHTETVLNIPCINPTNENSWTAILKKAHELNARFGNIYVWMQDHIPLFRQVFRWGSSKFWPMILTPMPILICLLMEEFSGKKIFKIFKILLIMPACKTRYKTVGYMCCTPDHKLSN